MLEYTAANLSEFAFQVNGQNMTLKYKRYSTQLSLRSLVKPRQGNTCWKKSWIGEYHLHDYVGEDARMGGVEDIKDIWAVSQQALQAQTTLVNVYTLY